MTKIYSKLLAFAAVSLLLFSLACDDDNSTGPDDKDKTSSARADNNTLVTSESVIPLTLYGIFHQQFRNEIWITVKESKSSPTSFVIMIAHPLPSGDSGKLDYIKSLFEIKSTEFSISSLEINENGYRTEWVPEASALDVKTKGTLYYKRNANNTISFWTNQIELANENYAPTEFKKFDFKFTFDANVDISTTPKDYVNLSSDK